MRWRGAGIPAPRRKYPFMGKARIHAMLAGKGFKLSASTVGRILSRALASGAVPHVSFCEGRAKPKRRRRFAKWAQRWKYGSKASKPGELLQIDHMTYSRDGQTLKEFRAARAEFWSLYNGPLNVAAVTPALANCEFFFNYERHHASLDYQTPNEYLVATEAK